MKHARHGRFRPRRGRVNTVGLGCVIVLGLAVVSGSPVTAQTERQPVPGAPLESIIDLPTIPIEQGADVIVVIRPDADYPLHRAAPTERVIRGDIRRLVKGPMPLTIVHTPRTIIAPLRAGVPVKLFLKAFANRNAYYIVGVFPESYGEQP